MPNQATLIENVKAIVQNTSYTATDILAAMNEGQRRIAGGMFIAYPDYTQLISAPLPDLITTSDLETSVANPYINLPTDFGRVLYFLVSTTNDRRIEILGSLAELLDIYPSLDDTHDVREAAVAGSRLYYQGCPSTAEDLVAYYFRKPTDMATYTAATISFAESGSRIADTAKGLTMFTEGQTIDVTGTTDNNTNFKVSAVASDYSYLTVTTSPTDEAAGGSVTIKSRPHGIPDHMHEDLLVNYAASLIFERMGIGEPKYETAADRYLNKVNAALIRLQSQLENVPEPVVFKVDRW